MELDQASNHGWLGITGWVCGCMLMLGWWLQPPICKPRHSTSSFVLQIIHVEAAANLTTPLKKVISKESLSNSCKSYYMKMFSAYLWAYNAPHQKFVDLQLWRSIGLNDSDEQVCWPGNLDWKFIYLNDTKIKFMDL